MIGGVDILMVAPADISVDLQLDSLLDNFAAGGIVVAGRRGLPGRRRRHEIIANRAMRLDAVAAYCPDLLVAAEDLEPGQETRLLQIVSVPLGRDQTMAIGDEDVVTAIDRGLVRIQPKSVDGLGFQRRHFG